MNGTDYSTYAKLGGACQNNMDCLLSNTKYIDPRNPVYNIPFTAMDRYPGPIVVKNEEKKKDNENKNKIDLNF
jgi:hypothetical protein